MFNVNTFVLLFSFCEVIFGEIFSAIEELESLANDEKFIIEELKILADDLAFRKLNSWQDEHQLAQKDVKRYVTNPLNAFAIIKRSTSDIELIKARFPDGSRELLKKIEIFLPSEEDLLGAVAGLLRLQSIYKLKSDDFANGIIDGEVTRKPFTPHDLYVIGSEALKLQDENFLAQEYLNLAWDQMHQGLDDDEEVNEDDLVLLLLTSYKQSGNFDGVTSVIDYLMDKHPDSPEFVEAKNTFQDDLDNGRIEKVKIRNPFEDEIVVDGTFSHVKEEIYFSKVCRGNVTKSPAELANLHCRYVSNSPFSKLARFKVEEVNLKPYIALYIDVLSDDEIKFLQTITRPKARRAEVLSPDLKVRPSNVRIAQLAWHYDNEHEIIARISKRVEDMTGLSQETSEAIQVQNYGIGGHYVPHWDHRIKREQPFETAGNRIATTLFYLSDVEKGGATVFPYLQLKIPARKGAAAFWYNLHPSGDGIYKTIHAACPVLLGSKWVANRWIREHGQEFRRPCIPGYFEEEEEEDYFNGIF